MEKIKAIGIVLHDISGLPLLSVVDSVQNEKYEILRLFRCRIYALDLYGDEKMIEYIDSIIARHEEYFQDCLIEV